MRTMTRKDIKLITLEIYNIIVRISENEACKINDIARVVGVDRKVIRRIIANHLSGQDFKPANGKLRDTNNIRNRIHSRSEQFIFNIISTENAITQSELASAIFENLGGQIPSPQNLES